MLPKHPLTGVRVLEFAGLAPGPFCGLLLASYGASVIRIDRPGSVATRDALTSYKSSISLDLKYPPSLAVLSAIIPYTDILIDTFRPGVLEKLALGPLHLHKINPRLIVVRLTGFRRDGKYRSMAGHDINYLAVSGVLSMLGARGQPPSPPINILGDFAGGGMVAFVGALLALLYRSTSGQGQVVDANMVDGVNFLATYPRLASKPPLILSGPRGTNALDGGAPYYACYECKDSGRYMSVGALEPQFFAMLLHGLGLEEGDILPAGLNREDKRSWPHMRAAFSRQFKTKTRKQWEAEFDGTDACCVPVLEFEELEAGNYDHRPVVGLSHSSARPVDMAWVGRPMIPGHGGEQAMKEWLGWEVGKHFDIQSGVMVLKEQARL